jgi:hypothetical protein
MPDAMPAEDESNAMIQCFNEHYSCVRFPRGPQIRHLRLVAEIADAGSVTKAADRLFLTSPP